MLALEVEWLTGVCWATRTPADLSPEWPVQPDRLFSALVSTWGAHGEPEDERQVLEWLERQPPPRLFHAPGKPRTPATTFVPPNDDALLNLRVIPDRRRRQPRQFPASVLPPAKDGIHLRVVWDDASPDAESRRALDSLARDTAYVGHSASVVRCRFVEASGDVSLERGITLAAPYKGRLSELVSLYAAHMRGAERSRPERAALAMPLRPAANTVSQSVFAPTWIVLAHCGGERPDIRACAGVGRALRKALMSAHSDPLPSWLSGHEQDGSPACAPHLAIVPLTNLTGSYPDGRFMGLAIVLPRALDVAWQEAATPAAYAERMSFDRALMALRPPVSREKTAEDGSLIALPWRRGAAWRIRREAAPQSANLAPGPYLRASKIWATVTPVVLDRFPRDDRADRSLEAQEIVASACVNIGLPRPVTVRLNKHAAFSAVPSAWPPGGAPRWTGWARPGSLANRPLVHATVEFAEEVIGPVILGAGRFVGLGLCRPAE